MCVFLMASSGGNFKEVTNHGTVSSYNGSLHGEWGMPTFQHQQSISLDWTLEEQTILEDGLAKYASESNIIRYAKIAVTLRNKTVRDVALRCRWITKKEMSKRRKEDFIARRGKDKKEKFLDSLGNTSHLAIQAGLSFAPEMISSCNGDGISFKDIGGSTQQLLQQNNWAFKQISTNLATAQIHENIALLSQARDNIFKILANLHEMGPTMRKMPPLPKLNEELANSILPLTTVTIQQ